MPDDFDRLTEKELKLDAQVHSFRYELPAGVAGICDECEEHSPRLVGGLCARCRDEQAKRCR